MLLENDRLVFDQFNDTTRLMSVVTSGAIGVISLASGLWVITVILLGIAVACAFNRHRVTFDSNLGKVRDERGFIGSSKFFESRFEEILAIEVGYQDVHGRHGSQRFYRAELIYADRSRNSFTLISDTDLEKVAQAATSVSTRSGVPVEISLALKRLKSELDGLTESASKTNIAG